MRKWIPGNAHAGMKWLAARRPSVYREQKDTKHHLDADDAFLRFLDQHGGAASATATCLSIMCPYSRSPGGPIR